MSHLISYGKEQRQCCFRLKTLAAERVTTSGDIFKVRMMAMARDKPNQTEQKLKAKRNTLMTFRMILFYFFFEEEND